MKPMNFPALYAIVVRLLMFAQRAFFLISRQGPERKTEQVRVLFHIVDEFLTAVVLRALTIVSTATFCQAASSELFETESDD